MHKFFFNLNSKIGVFQKHIQEQLVQISFLLYNIVADNYNESGWWWVSDDDEGDRRSGWEMMDNLLRSRMKKGFIDNK